MADRRVEGGEVRTGTNVAPKVNVRPEDAPGPLYPFSKNRHQRLEEQLEEVILSMRAEVRLREQTQRRYSALFDVVFEQYRRHNARGSDGPCECDVCMTIRQTLDEEEVP